MLRREVVQPLAGDHMHLEKLRRLSPQGNHVFVRPRELCREPGVRVHVLAVFCDAGEGALLIDIVHDSPTNRRDARSQVGKKLLFRKPGPWDGAGDAAGEGIAAAVEDFGMGERGAGDLLKEVQPTRPVGGDRGAGFDFDAGEVRVVTGEEIYLVSRMVAPEKQARAAGPVGHRLEILANHEIFENRPPERMVSEVARLADSNERADGAGFGACRNAFRLHICKLRHPALALRK